MKKIVIMNKGNLKVLIWIVSISAVIGIVISIYAYFVEESSMGNLAGAILAIVGFIGTITTLVALIKEKEKPAIQFDFNTATKLADKTLKEEIALRDKTISDLKTNHISRESNPITKTDIGLMRILSIIGLFTIPLGTGIFGALYGIIFSIIGLKKKIRNTQMISSIGLTFFILFVLLIIITLISEEVITFWILWSLCFLFGIIYSIIWIKTLNAIAKEQGYNVKELQKQSFIKYKKALITTIISLSLFFCMVSVIGFLIGYYSEENEEDIEVVESSNIENSNVLQKGEMSTQIFFSCTYRESCKWNDYAKEWSTDCSGYEENSLFTWNKDKTMFTHTTESMKSTYYVQSKEYDKVNDVHTYNVISDVGNKYYYVFDPKNKEIRAIINTDAETVLIKFYVKAIF